MYKQNLSGLIDYPDHVHNTRGRDIAVPSFQRLASCQKSLSYNGPKIWNTLPSDIKSSPSINIFKKRLKQHFVNSYAFN